MPKRMGRAMDRAESFPRISMPATDKQDDTEAQLLDTIASAIKKMVARGKERGYLTYEELNAALPQDQESSEKIEDTMTMPSELGINAIASEVSEDRTEAPSEAGGAENNSKGDGDDICRPNG